MEQERTRVTPIGAKLLEHWSRARLAKLNFAAQLSKRYIYACAVRVFLVLAVNAW